MLMATKKGLRAEDILGVNDTQTEPVDVPEWGGTVYIRVVSSGEGADLIDKVTDLVKQKKAQEATYLLLSKCLVDESGTPLFSAEDARKLSERSHKVIRRLESAAMRLNGFTPEGAAKNAFGGVAAAASPTDSPSDSGT